MSRHRPFICPHCHTPIDPVRMETARHGAQEYRIGAGIHDNDLLVVDRALTARHGSIVIAVVDGEFTVKRLEKRGAQVRLRAEHPDYAPIDFQDGQELHVWGVVTQVIHSFVA